MTELTWEGKYKDGKKVTPVRIALPFQTIETINESNAEREKQQGLSFEQKTEWRNRLIWGDKKYVLPSLLPEFAGKVNLIYIDPPFNVGADFSFTAKIADNPETEENEALQFEKQPSIIEQKAYRDTWGRGLESYLQWFYETALLLKELLASNGTLYVHLDWHVCHYVKAILDEIFGRDLFRNEIVWRRTNVHNSVNAFGQIHDVIFRYAKSEDETFNVTRTPYAKAYVEGRFTRKDDRGFYDSGDLTGPGTRKGDSGKEWFGFNPTKTGRHWQPPKSLYEQVGEALGHLPMMERLDFLFNAGYIIPPAQPGMAPRAKVYIGRGLPVQDLWAYQPHTKGLLSDGSEIDADVAWLPAGHPERLEYDTQKPEGLLRRIINASSNEGDIVLDCFCGSGTTAAVSEKLNRRWITCDLGRFAIHTARKRLLGNAEIKPFVVQNLGKYERQQWMFAEFETPEDRFTQERDYRHFIADLYHAKPLDGYRWLHGAKAGRMVHIGSVEAPVTVDDIKATIKEFWKMAGGENAAETNGIDFLGWDFAFDVNETAAHFANANNVKASFKKIPREVLEKKAVEQGDIKFYELASLGVKVKAGKKQIEVTLKDFIIPPDDVPEEVRGKITHWSQWIDYWAIDWNYRDDTFHNEWQSYRTKKEPKIDLTARNTDVKPGKYTVLVKVIDILGNDTTKAVEVEV